VADKPTRVLLIRHGTNDYVKNGLLAARTVGVHLNEEGRAQAEALAQRLADTQITAIYMSPLERTRETAAPLGGCLGLEPQILLEVLESDCGEWTGQKLEDLRKLDNWRQVQAHPSAFRFPGGESFLDIQTRMVGALTRLSTEHAEQTIAIVTHSDPIKVAVAYYMGMALDLFQRLDIAPASITELDFSPMQTRLVRLNDCCHVPPSPEPPAAEKASGETAQELQNENSVKSV
jgi:probable phosphomutase (TIGR03848 family)